MPPLKQLTLKLPTQRRIHGGDTQYGKRGQRKESRPHNPKLPLHVTLRSSRARAAWSLLNPKHKFKLEALARELAKQFGVRLYHYVNVGNHLHLVILAPNSHARARFFKALSGLTARMITGARKGNPVGKFWDGLIFSRVVTWGRDYKNTSQYIIKNALESLGVIKRSEFSRALAALLETGVWYPSHGL